MSKMCNHATLRIVLWIMAGMTSVAMSGTVFTLHAYKRRWNEAAQICEINDSHLISLSNLEKQTVYDHFMETVWLNVAKDHIWFGLHSPGGDNQFLWSNCDLADFTQFDNWMGGEPHVSESKRCSNIHKNTNQWMMEKCNHGFMFVCEAQTADSCSYRSENGPPDQATANFYITTETIDDRGTCSELCSQTVPNGESCWAFNFINSPFDNCELYFTSNPFLFDNTQNGSVGSDFNVKECYSGNETLYSSDDISSLDDNPMHCQGVTVTTAASTTSKTTSTTAASITTEMTVSSPSSPTVTQTTCQCACSDLPVPSTGNLSVEEKVKKIVSELTVSREKLSSTVRKKTSAEDRRTSAVSVGVVASVFMCLVLGFIVVSDVIALVRYILRRVMVTRITEDSK